MKKLNRTYVMGIAFIVFAVWVAFQTALIPEKLVSNEPGPKLFPFISAIGMIIMAILSMILLKWWISKFNKLTYYLFWKNWII